MSKKMDKAYRVLVKQDFIIPGQLREARKVLKEKNKDIFTYLVQKRYIKKTVLLNFLSQFFGMPRVTLRQLKNIDWIFRNSLGDIQETLEKYLIFPLKIEKKSDGKVFILAMADPGDPSHVKYIKEHMRFFTNPDFEVEIRIALAQDIEAAIYHNYIEPRLGHSELEMYDF